MSKSMTKHPLMTRFWFYDMLGDWSGFHMTWLEIDLYENTCINFNMEAPLILFKEKKDPR